MNKHNFLFHCLITVVAGGLLNACHSPGTPNSPPRTDSLSEAAAPIHATLPAVPLFSVRHVCAGQPWPNVAWIHIHENEYTAWQVAQAVLATQHSGCIDGLQHGGSRNVVVMDDNNQPHPFDPNRMFTSPGRLASLHQFGSQNPAIATRIASAASDFYRHYLQGKQLIVAVHNNYPGGYSIHSYENGLLARNALAVNINPHHDPDDFLYVVNQRAFAYFQQRGFNVVLQHPNNVNDDGSLSVYAAQQGQDYINIEAGFGHITAQTAMLEAVLTYMHDYYAVDVIPVRQ